MGSRLRRWRSAPVRRKLWFPPKWAESALIYAAESGDLSALSPFTYEFDINHKIRGNRTALMLSAMNGKFDAVKMLIDEGADSAMRDNQN